MWTWTAWQALCKLRRTWCSWPRPTSTLSKTHTLIWRKKKFARSHFIILREFRDEQQIWRRFFPTSNLWSLTLSLFYVVLSLSHQPAKIPWDPKMAFIQGVLVHGQTDQENRVSFLNFIPVKIAELDQHSSRLTYGIKTLIREALKHRTKSVRSLNVYSNKTSSRLSYNITIKYKQRTRQHFVQKIQ